MASPPAADGVEGMMRPRYWTLLQDPSIKTVFVTGCGGGFDFVHSMTVVPALLAMGKKVVIGSYSFGDPTAIDGGELIWSGSMAPDNSDHADVYEVDGSCIPSRHYGPEVGLCQYLDIHYPKDEAARAAQSELIAREIDTRSNSGENYPIKTPSSRWCAYAYNARCFNVIQLRAFYTRLCNTHGVDAIVSIDGGSDSLMAGDEAGLGDPIEDAVTIASIATLRGAEVAGKNTVGEEEGDVTAPLVVVPVGTKSSQRREMCHETHFDSIALAKPLRARLLIAIGVGCDRFNAVSDAATLRAVAELSNVKAPPDSTGREGERGFLGSMALEPTSTLSQKYRDLIEFLQNRADFRSVIANSICETSNGSGSYGSDVVPPSLKRRVAPGELFLWPLMSFQFAFWIPCVFQRALLGPRLLPCRSVVEMYTVFHALRGELKVFDKLRPTEVLPSTAESW